MSYHGNIQLEDTIDIKFSTVDDTGLPTTLAGTPVISAYVGNSTTQITAGITLSVDFDGVTGLHNVRVEATAANGYTAATNVSLVITTGTVDAVSVVGYVVGAFSIGARGVNVTHYGGTAGTFTSGRPNVNASHVGGSGIDQSAGVLGVNVKQFGGTNGTFASGRPEVNASHVSGDSAAADALEAAFDGTVGAHEPFGILDRGTLQSATSTTAVLRAAAAYGDVLKGATLWITGGTGIGQRKEILSYVGATDTATVSTWDVTPDNTSTYTVFASSASATLAEIAAALFTTDSSETYASAVAGSVVKEIADNAAGGGLDAAGVRAAVGLASANLDTQLGDLPTNAELATSQASADDATLTAISGLDSKLNTIDDFLDLEIAAIKAKTDSLTFTVAGQVDSNIKSVTDDTVGGAGTEGDPWGPAA